MRTAVVLVAAWCTAASADDAASTSASMRTSDDASVRFAAAVGAGGQGEATYGALDVSADLMWRGARVVIGARGVWEDGVFRRREWARPIDGLGVLRHLEARTAHAAIAAGALAPSRLAHVTDGYRAALDDRPRVGVRGAVTTARVDARLELDDVLDPAMVGGAATVAAWTGWSLHAAGAVDPSRVAGRRSAFELGGARRWEAPGQRVEAGAAIVAEPRDGAGVVGFAAASIERGARWTATADLRVGSGTNGAAFGPLYRVERAALLDDARAGVGAGLALEVVGHAGWAAVSGRTRPGLGPLGAVALGAPMGRYVQLAAWIAASRDAAAGATELRIAWAPRWFSAVQAARMYDGDTMDPRPTWSLTAWFGATGR